MEADARANCGWTRRIADDYDFLIRRAEYYLAANRFEPARLDYIKASLQAPHKPGPYVGLGLVALQTHDLQKARTAFETACRLDPACARAFCGLAIVNHTQSRSEQALGMYCRCLELDGDNITALLGLMELSAQHGRFKEIKRFLRQYAVRHPEDVASRLALAAVHLNEDQFAAAREVLMDVLIIEPRNATASAILEELAHVQINTEIERARQMYLIPNCSTA